MHSIVRSSYSGLCDYEFYQLMGLTYTLLSETIDNPLSKQHLLSFAFSTYSCFLSFSFLVLSCLVFSFLPFLFFPSFFFSSFSVPPAFLFLCIKRKSKGK